MTIGLDLQQQAHEQMAGRKKTYRVFADYRATGVWGEIGDDPYVIEYDQLKRMGASDTSIYLLKKMQYVFEWGDLALEVAPQERVYIEWAARTAANRLTIETGHAFRYVE